MASADVALKQSNALFEAYLSDPIKRDWSKQLAEIEERLVEIERLLVLEELARAAWGLDWWCPGRRGGR